MLGQAPTLGAPYTEANGLKYFVGKVGEFRENLITTLIIKIEDFIFVYFVYQVLSLLQNFTFKIGKNPVKQNNHGKYLKTF